tara:strand:+ start:86 stop:292 length:207 start_codon:yes stop_codon:yes gene_type:complete
MSQMTWRSLLETMLLADCDTCELDDTVEVYDASSGEYYPADLIEFPSDDELAGNMLISINATPYQQTT